MYDLDHMLNGSGIHRHHQDMIQQAQHAKLAHEVKTKQTSNKVILPLRAILAALVNFSMR